MGWIAMIRLGLSLLGNLTEYLKNKQLLEAGEARAVAKALKEASDEMAAVREVRLKLRRDPDFHQRLRNEYSSRRKPSTVLRRVQAGAGSGERTSPERRDASGN